MSIFYDDDERVTMQYPDSPRLSLRDEVRIAWENIMGSGDWTNEADAFLDWASDRGWTIELPR